MTANKKRIIGIVAVIALVAILGACLVACNASDYASKLAKKGYVVEVTKYDGSYSGGGYPGSGGGKVPDYLSSGETAQLEWSISAYRVVETRYDTEEYSVEIYKYKTKAAAQAAYDELEEEYRGMGYYDDVPTYELKGKILFVGDRDAVNDAM